MAAPSLVRLPAPLIAPPSVRSAVPPMPRLPARLIALVVVTAVLASNVVPPAAFNTPAPSAVLLARISPPAFKATGPRKVLVPPSVRSAVPFFTRPPMPLMAPLSANALLPPTVRLPLSTASLPRVTEALLSSVVPAAAVRAPVPSAVLLPTTKVPPLSKVPPV
ncbi:hypothetical protein PFLmoz3_04704 [Pseudomonas fluorescens]|uniref:Uncharacterized protein n=1 Tax=Pseudomonas fluorescens TaxID=294 RepID=A0A109LDK5_PSEFL|nr:hypothetical protein PFLmoz3_04704 [Pseudomonas fluorescens]